MSRHADPRTKIELLRAAEAAFAEDGLVDTRVEDITARAGVSKGAFYLHFRSKDDCWRQIVEGFLARLASRLEPPPQDPAGGPTTVEDLRTHWHEHDVDMFDFCWQNRALLRMLIGGGGGTSYAYLVDQFAERAAALSASWVRHGIAAGLYRPDVDPAVVAELISGAYDRLARKLLREAKRPDLEGWCLQALDLFTAGLLRRSSDSDSVVIPQASDKARKVAAR